MGVCNSSMFCCTLLYVHSSIAIILMDKRKLVALLGLSSWCLAMVEGLFLAVPRGCLWFVIVVFPDHTHLIFFKSTEVGTLLPFVPTYHSDLPKIRDIVDKNWSIIESSDELKDIYQSKPVMAFRRPKSLRDFLVRARLKPNSDDDDQNG